MGDSDVVGNLLFLYNCSMTAIFVLCMRTVTKQVPAYTALAIVYCFATIGMSVAAFLVVGNAAAQTFLCPECGPFWYFPASASFALAYWVFGTSVLSYMA